MHQKRSTTLKQHTLTLQTGFSILELSIVLLIIAVLSNHVVLPLLEQQRQTHYAKTEQQLQNIATTVVQFLIANKRLPCPSATGGIESYQEMPTPNCSTTNGFVPSTTLSLNGARNSQGLLLDSWNRPIRYTISEENNNLWLDSKRLSNLTSYEQLFGDLIVCTNANDCSGTATQLTNTAPFILLSVGESAATGDEHSMENSGEATLLGWGMNNDEHFVLRERQHTIAANNFDDLVYWTSPYLLQRALFDSQSQ